jgi:predicted nuclease of predicted toxin-antitoxin system
MPRFLIDANLPYYFSSWRGEDFVHQFDIDDRWTDDQIWNYALEHDLIIVSKDADFSDRMIFREPPPKVIHVRVGNVRMKEFFAVLTQRWPEASELIRDNKLVFIYRDRVEAIQ